MTKEDIVDRLCLYDDGDIEVVNGETLLITKLSAGSDGFLTEAYLHEIYGGINSNQIDRLQEAIKMTLPTALREFYAQMNGASFFCNSLSIRGLREAYDRNCQTRLPISLEYGNVIEVPRESREQGYVRFGFYSYCGSEAAIHSADGLVRAFPRFEMEPIQYEWASLSHFLFSEIDRMYQYYCNNKERISPFEPIPPIWEQ